DREISQAHLSTHTPSHADDMSGAPGQTLELSGSGVLRVPESAGLLPSRSIPGRRPDRWRASRYTVAWAPRGRDPKSPWVRAPGPWQVPQPPGSLVPQAGDRGAPEVGAARCAEG